MKAPFFASNVFLCLIRIGYAKKSSQTSPFLKKWLDQRCPPTQSAIWAYHGSLVDPLNGRTIANVEGIELVRQIAACNGSLQSKQLYKNRCQELSMSGPLAAVDARVDYASTVLSRKLFCYKPVDEPRQLLRHFRIRPGAPSQRVPTDQAVTVYDSASTFAQCNGQVTCHTEWSDGRSIWNKADVAHSDNAIRISIFGRPKSTYSPLPDFTKGPEPELTISRSAIIQLGPSKMETEGRFGARETYSYTLPSASRGRRNSSDAVPSVRYTRYGEAPVWYGPSRMCTLELEGRRIADIREAPLMAANAAATLVPGFLSVDNGITDDASAQQAVVWFRQSALQVLPDDVETLTWKEQTQRSAVRVLDRLRQATTLSSSI